MDIKTFAFLATSFFFAGCTTVSQESAFNGINTISQERGAMALQWVRTPQEALQVHQAVDRLLQSPLTQENAIRIVLINSPRLQQAYSDIGIAQSELVQAGLFTNPLLGYSVGKGNGITTTSLSLEFAFLDFLWIPMRKELAGLALEESKYRIGDEVLKSVRDAKQLYIDAQSAEEKIKTYEPILKSSEASTQLAARQYAAGNLSKRDYLKIREEYVRNHIESIRLQHENASAREALNKIMGVYGTQTLYTFTEYSDTIILGFADTRPLEKTAIMQRLDVAADQKRLEHDAAQAGYTIDTRLLSEGTFEMNREKSSGEANAIKTLGLKIAIPIFDIGQGRVGAAQARYLQSMHRLYETAINVRSEVREVYAKTRYAYDIAKEQQEQLVPIRRQILEETQKNYNGMLDGIDELLRDQRAFAQQKLELIDRIAEFKKEYAALEYVTGGLNGN